MKDFKIGMKLKCIKEYAAFEKDCIYTIHSIDVNEYGIFEYTLLTSYDWLLTCGYSTLKEYFEELLTMMKLKIYLPDNITLTLDLTPDEIVGFETSLCNPAVVLFEGKIRHVVITSNILMYTVWGEE